MFFRLFKARLKIISKSRVYIIWTLLFPLALGTLFYFAFSSIYGTIQSSPIPVVIEVKDSAIEEYQRLQAFSYLDRDRMEGDIEDYYAEQAAAKAMGQDFTKEPPVSEEDLDTLKSIESFDDVVNVSLDTFNPDYMTGDPKNVTRADLPFIQLMQDLEYDDGTKMIEEVTAGSHEEAEELLKDGDIAGIITVNKLSDVKLLINGGGVKHSILSNIISKYLYRVNLTIDRMNELSGDDFNSDTNVDELLDESAYDLEYVSGKSSAGENKDPFITYFYNLLSMVCVMGAIASLNTAVNTQANQSNLGIRIGSSPANKVLLELADLMAVTVVQMTIIVITLTYLVFGLKIKFGGDMAMIYLTACAASTVGTSLGFLVAHIGSFRVEIKEALAMVVILGGSFLSGLMFGDMKSILEEKCPLVNRINPCAVITDAFLSLNLYGVGKVYYRSMIYILVIDAVMLLIGLFLARKGSYKSL